MKFNSLIELKRTVHPIEIGNRTSKAVFLNLLRNFKLVESVWTQDREKAFSTLHKIKITLDRMKSEQVVIDLKERVNDVYNKWSSDLNNDYRLIALMQNEKALENNVMVISDSDSDSPEKSKEPEVIVISDSPEKTKRTDTATEFIFPEELYHMRSQDNYMLIDIRDTAAFESGHMVADINFIRIPAEVLTTGLSAATLEQRLDYDGRLHFKQRGIFDHLILMGDDDNGKNRKSKAYMVLKILTEWDPHTSYRGTPKILFGGFREFAEKYPALTIRKNTADLSNEEFLRLDEIEYPPLDDSLNNSQKNVQEKEIRNESAAIEPTIPISSPSVLTRNFYCKPTGDELKELRKMKPRQEESLEIEQMDDSQESKMNSFSQKLIIGPDSDSFDEAKKSSQPEGTSLRRTVSTPNIAEAINEPTVTEIPSFDRSKKPSPMRSSLPDIYDKGLDPVYGQTRPGYTGLKNPGNNCYLNTVIQILAHVSEITKFFHDQYRLQLNRNSKYKGTIADETARLVRALWSGQYTSISATTLKKVVAKYCPRFKGNSQEDCQEFLIILLDYLHEDLSYDIVNQTAVQNESEKAWHCFNKNKRSLVSDLFYGQSQTCVVCEYCSHSSVSYQVFACIPLDLVSEDGTVNLRERIDKYFKAERLEYRCEKCNFNKCIKKTGISRKPVYLIIQLVRFHEQPGRSFNKSKTMVQIPEFVNLTNLTVDGSSLSYSLQSIACHRGVIDCGHYKAYCFSHTKQSFTLFDDTSVTDVGSDIFMRKDVQQDAYILLYKLTPLHRSV